MITSEKFLTPLNSNVICSVPSFEVFRHPTHSNPAKRRKSIVTHGPCVNYERLRHSPTAYKSNHRIKVSINAGNIGHTMPPSGIFHPQASAVSSERPQPTDKAAASHQILHQPSQMSPISEQLPWNALVGAPRQGCCSFRNLCAVFAHHADSPALSVSPESCRRHADPARSIRRLCSLLQRASAQTGSPDGPPARAAWTVPGQPPVPRGARRSAARWSAVRSAAVRRRPCMYGGAARGAADTGRLFTRRHGAAPGERRDRSPDGPRPRRSTGRKHGLYVALWSTYW